MWEVPGSNLKSVKLCLLIKKIFSKNEDKRIQERPYTFNDFGYQKLFLKIVFKKFFTNQLSKATPRQHMQYDFSASISSK